MKNKAWIAGLDYPDTTPRTFEGLSVGMLLSLDEKWRLIRGRMAENPNLPLHIAMQQVNAMATVLPTCY